LTVTRVRVEAQTEAASSALAAATARAWIASDAPRLLIGLRGDLGAGKTTWARGMLAGLGHSGRVPSPTYTLLEHYPLPSVDFVHIDLYRLGGQTGDIEARGELDALGLREWLAQPRCWVVVEWPERSAELLARCDLLITLAPGDRADSRTIAFEGQTPVGARLLECLRDDSKSTSS
jgi:tRNA threonylcarbamoyladenosine biosynthesis protein TsaE